MKQMAKETDDNDVLALLRQRKEAEKKLSEMPADKKQATIDGLLARIAALESDLELLGYERPRKNASSGGEKQKRKPKTCSICKKPGHIAKTCPTAKAATA